MPKEHIRLAYVLNTCPILGARVLEMLCCSGAAGMLQAGLKGAGGKELT